MNYYIEVLRCIWKVKEKPFEGRNKSPSFSFPRPTFVYGEQVDEYEQKYLDEMNSIVDHLGQIDSLLFQQMKECLKKAPLLRRKYRKLL